MEGIWGGFVFLMIAAAACATVSACRRKTRGGLYPLSFHTAGHPLAPQPVADTRACRNVFSLRNSRHDQAFAARYPIGALLSFNGESHQISRRRKYLLAAPGQRAQFGYKLYFQAFENSEFPLFIAFSDQKHYRSAFLDGRSLTLTLSNGKTVCLPYEQLCFTARPKLFALEAGRGEYIVRRNSLPAVERLLFEAVLQKYAASVCLNPEDWA